VVTWLVLAVVLSAPGCAGLGARALNRDHLEYAAALADAEKREALFNIVRLRYGDHPVFLSTTQVISGYTFEGSTEARVAGETSGEPGAALEALGVLRYSDHPTFTFAPVTGEQFAESYIRPLSPGQLLPLAQSGLPIDVLLRLGVQSISGLQNSSPLGGSARAGSPDFFLLVNQLRNLQEAGGLALRVQADAKNTRIFFVLREENDRDIRHIQDDVRRLLGMAPAAREVEIVYGSGQPSGGRVAILTRSVLGMLGEVAAQIEIPVEDVQTGRAQPAVPVIGADTRPVIVVRSGPSQPSTSYVSLSYGGRWFWIEETDFKSKLALSILDLVRNVAEGSHSPQAPVITIPAG